MAVWHNNKRYPAQITKVLEPGTVYSLSPLLITKETIQDVFLSTGNFEVIFYDGFIMQVKAKQMTRIPKDQADKMVNIFYNFYFLQLFKL